MIFICFWLGVQIKKDEKDVRRRERHTWFLQWHLEKRDFLKDLGVDGDNIWHCIFSKWAWRLWVVLVWLRLETSGGIFFSSVVMKRRVYKVRGISWLVDELLDSQEIFYSLELVLWESRLVVTNVCNWKQIDRLLGRRMLWDGLVVRSNSQQLKLWTWSWWASDRLDDQT